MRRLFPFPMCCAARAIEAFGAATHVPRDLVFPAADDRGNGDLAPQT